MPQRARRIGRRARNLELLVSGLHGALASLLPILTCAKRPEGKRRRTSAWRDCFVQSSPIGLTAHVGLVGRCPIGRT